MSQLSDALEQYLQVRRGLGFKLHEAGNLLADFVEHLERAGASVLTTELALAWATRSVGVQPFRWKARLSMVRGFARYLHALDPVHEVPPADPLAYRRPRPTPQLYTQAQIVALLRAADGLRPPLRARTYRTMFGLLAVSGLRVGEAIRLDRDDLDLESGVVVRDSKYGKSRVLPLHPSTLDALSRYARQRDALCPRPKTPAVFVSTAGTRLVYPCVRSAFVELAREAGLQPRSGKRDARIHDLRHGFAVQTLLDWYRSDVDVSAQMPLLSSYLGHSTPAASYWYLQAAPELLVLAAERLERALGEPR
jgi:integrase/recombinase XerD